MHKMLKDYLENYTDFGNREKELEKNEEYVEIEKNIDKLILSLRKKDISNTKNCYSILIIKSN